MAGARESLLHGDLLLLQQIEYAGRVGEIGFEQNLARQLGSPGGVLGESRCAHGEHGPYGGRIGYVVEHRGEERKVAQLSLDERVQLGGGVMRGSQLAQHEREHRHVRQILECQPVHVEVPVRVGDAARGHVVAQAGQGRVLVEMIGRLGGRLVDVGNGKARQRGDGLGRVGRFLQLAQQSLLVHDALAFLGRKRAVHGGQARGSVVVGFAGRRHDLDRGGVPVFEEQLGAQALVVVALEGAAQLGERLLVAQVVQRRVIVVQPAGERGHRVDDAVGVTHVVLAQQELGMRECGFHQPLVESRIEQGAHFFLEDACQALPTVVDGHVHLHDGKRLANGVGKERAHVVRDARIEQGARQRGLVAAEQRVKQDLDGHGARPIRLVADDETACSAGVFGGGVHRLADVGHGWLASRLDGGLGIGGNTHRHRVGARSAAAFAKLGHRQDGLARHAGIGCCDGAGPERLGTGGNALLVCFALLGGHGRQVPFIDERERALCVHVAV